MRPFQFINGPWENSELPTIVKENPAGGDPHILAVIRRVHNPDALHELCRLANNALETAAAPDMLAAFRGDPEMPEEISPLSWLAEAITELRNRGPEDNCEDPDAFWEMVSELETLERNGLAAIAKAEGR